MQNTAPTKPKEILELEKYYNITLSETNKGELDKNQYVIENGKVVELDLSGNQISDITPLSNLTALTWLSLNENQISDITPISNLTTLTELYLDNNQISDITPISNLTTLTGLYLWDNNISDITPISNLTTLTKLALHDNLILDINSVKILLSKLTNLKTLYIDSNKCFDDIVGLNLTLDENQLDTIKNYFAKLEEESVEIQMPVKVMLMGNHNVGKSTFLNSLLDIPDEPDSTHILRIKDYQGEGAQELPQAIFFDFGGQDYYHGIYKAFMTKGAINVIFWQIATDNNVTSPDKSERYDLTQNFNRKALD